MVDYCFIYWDQDGFFDTFLHKSQIQLKSILHFHFFSLHSVFILTHFTSRVTNTQKKHYFFLFTLNISDVTTNTFPQTIYVSFHFNLTSSSRYQQVHSLF